MLFRKKIISLVSALLVLSAVFLIGISIGFNLNPEHRLTTVLHREVPPQVAREEIDFTPFWQAWDILESRYVDIDKVKRQDMVYNAISGLLKATGDPYTMFFPPRENKEFNNEIRGSFEGVGMEVALRKSIITVVAPLKGTPAEKAGIRAGDKILGIDDKPTIDLSLEEAIRNIRGPRGTSVQLTILREGEDETRTISVMRDVIKIPVLEIGTQEVALKNGDGGPRIPEDIFVLRLYNFSEDSPNRFREALRAMIEGKKTKLIIDVRNNPGGYLEAAVDMVSWFLPQGQIIVREDFGGKVEQTVYRSKGYDIFENLPLMVLVNQGSASASEILAGALRDHKLATIVGEKTFGKGSVQELLPVTSETSLKVTIAKWLTPNGVSISEKGLEPDVEVKMTPEDIEAHRDPVLERAIELLQNQG